MGAFNQQLNIINQKQTQCGDAHTSSCWVFVLPKKDDFMNIVKCCWSGGKDSSCATHLHLTQGDKVIVANYVPMFTEEIPLILKEHYEFIMQTIELWKQMGAEVYQVHGMTYWDYVHKTSTRGKNKGKPFGFPFFGVGNCGFNRDSKSKSIAEIDEKYNLEYDYEDVAIAFDEINRQQQLNETKRSILVEEKITEFEATEYCKKNGIYSPHYSFDFGKKKKRDGCVLCPQARPKERIEWFKQYPEAFELVLELQDFVRKERPNQYPLRTYKFFIEEDIQLSLFEIGKRWIIN